MPRIPFTVGWRGVCQGNAGGNDPAARYAGNTVEPTQGLIVELDEILIGMLCLGQIVRLLL
jgi:hypothetical protein